MDLDYRSGACQPQTGDYGDTGNICFSLHRIAFNAAYAKSIDKTAKHPPSNQTLINPPGQFLRAFRALAVPVHQVIAQPRSDLGVNGAKAVWQIRKVRPEIVYASPLVHRMVPAHVRHLVLEPHFTHIF
ncbi:MAG: hypothetical protein ACLPJJ_08060 [Acidocella sp.]|uniref:hypothetical protein n=1 Tax=Acidocella sp. TaxID=50710 RepID=UPI003FD7EB72